MKTRLQKEFEEFRSIIQHGQRFVLTTHVNPDGDGLGCEIALARFLQSQGKQTTILNHNATPSYYLYLDRHNEIHQFQAVQHQQSIQEADVIVVLDTNSPDRLASLKSHVLASKAKKVCIDHHLDKSDFADLTILDEPSAATGEILYRLLEFLGNGPFDEETATALYTALMTDTGSFRFPKTTPDIHRQVARLLECGANPAAIYQNVYEQGSVGRLQLLGNVLSTFQVVHEGKVACVTVTRRMLEETGTSEPDTDNLVNYTLTIRGVQIGLMFTELSDGVKISFRSKGEIWINELAKEFGGNGHQNAAGARVHNTTVANLKEKVLEYSKRYIIQ